MKTSEILGKAADVIAEHGLAKGEYQQPDGSCCTLGAIREALGLGWEGIRSPQCHNAIRAFACHLSIDLSEWDSLVDGAVARIGTDWNDRPDRTAKQVIAELRAAAQTEREAGR